ncbi:MAG: ABC transporter substrate-binding protein [Erythrobacter sp.]
MSRLGLLAARAASIASILGMMKSQSFSWAFSWGRVAVMTAAGAAALASCAPAGKPQADGASDADSDGVQTGFGPTFVSLNPCTDAILVAVAEPEQILALSHYSRDPRSSSIEAEVAERFAITGGTAEEVFVLAPDVVLAGAFLQPATSQAFADQDLQVATFGIASEVKASFAQIRRIAELAQHPDRGETLIEEIEASLGRNIAPAGASNISAVLWQPGQVVPGEQTLIAQLMSRAGFASHSAAKGLGQADYLTLEQLLADPPDVLLVAGNTRAQHHSALAAMDGTQIEQFDPGLLYCGGPTIIRAMDRLGEIRSKIKQVQS